MRLSVAPGLCSSQVTTLWWADLTGLRLDTYLGLELGKWLPDGV